MALVLHPHPQHGGTMNNKLVYALYQSFVRRGFSTLRFNFRGVGRSQGSFDRGEGELSDAAAALDWLQTYNPNAGTCWVAGFSFGAWIGMQLLMRRPEIESFIAVAPPANIYDFTFLAPCPSSGLILQGDQDTVVPVEVGAEARDQAIAPARHQDRLSQDPRRRPFFADNLDAIAGHVDGYIRDHVRRADRSSRRFPRPRRALTADSRFSFSQSSSVSERIAHQDRVVALRAGREQRDRRLDQLLDAADIFDRGRRQVGPGARAARALAPAFDGLVDRLDRGLGAARGGQMVHRSSPRSR